ncbi:MAG TPA: carboxypeptidase-like regulatory domain-containing protein [Candidatus Cybelea sp.]|nr:carboxypeptidase-like regulatory domain-containing protein [Candidatus Cybelea sp.]
MLSKRVVLLVVALSCLFTLTPSALYSQASSTGTVAGLVTDSAGGIVVGATVTLTDKATNAPKTTISNDAGRYIFINVTPGMYDVKITMKGFRQVEVSEQEVLVGQTLTLNVKLEVGAMAETIEVKVAAGAELQTTNATIGTTMSGETLLDLPNLNRDATSLLTFQPNTAPAVGGGDVYGGQVAGSLSDQNTYMLDGGNITSDLEGDNNYTDNGVGGMGAMPTPLESIQEFKVATSNQTADFATSAGGQVMLVSKRGTDSFHGSAYEFFRSQVLDANTWDNNRHGNPIVKFHDNRFGGSVGGPMLPGKRLGGKTYFYAFYEGRRYPGTATVEEWAVPSALMRQGILQYNDCNAACQANSTTSPPVLTQVNLKTSTACGPAGGVACDPRGIGISPAVSQLWNTYLPMPNDPSYNSNGADALNIQGYRAPLSLPIKDDYGMGRIDHDLGDKWRLFLSYRVFRETAPSTNQIDIGGLLPGDKLGVPAAASTNPRHPSYSVVGLTGTLTPTLINEFHISYLRNDWSWGRQGVTDALSGVPAGVEFQDSHFGCLCPINMDTQDARNRVWDGHDWNYNDTLSWSRGNHFMQYGGSIIHWWDHHVRDDQVVAGLPDLVYQLNKGSGLVTSANNRPIDLPSSLNSIWDTQYAETLGLIGTEAQLFVRGGTDFHLTGAKTFADTSIIDSYSLYFNDSWKIRPTITLNYGLEWGTQMPPYEINGVQDIAVDQSGVPINSTQYLQNTVTNALNGKVYNPNIGFEPIGAVGGHPKYPFNPYYGGFSPRVAVAWNPKFSEGFLGRLTGNGKTVIRAGFSRLYDRNNGVDLVLVPLLGYGFGQTIRCTGASPVNTTTMAATPTCNGSVSTTPTNAFRLGVDGNTGPFPAVQQTLPIPAVPGINSPAGSNLSFLDSNWRPGVNNGVTFGIQRELPDNVVLEVAYVGKWSTHLYQGLDLNNVPWMMTRGGQTFAKAFAAVWQADHGGTAAASQPFFENSLPASYLMSTNTAISKYNTANPTATLPMCTTLTCAVQTNEGGGPLGTANISTEYVYGVWADLDRTFTFGSALPATTQGYNSMIANSTSGFSNYQAGIVSVQKRTGHGLMLNGNFTWSKTLSTVGINQEFTQANASVPFNLRYDYGPAPFDTRFVLNLLATYQLPFGKGQRFGTNNGILDRIIGGWSFSPIFTWNSGLVMETYTGSCDEYGQGNVAWCSGLVPMMSAGSYSHSPHYGVVSSGGIGSQGDAANGGSGVNLFSNPQAVYNTLQPIVLGLNDGRAHDLGPLYGQHRWNLDFSLVKTTRITERVGATLYGQFFNALNHMEFSDPGQYGSAGIDLQNPAAFGVLNSQFNNPRQIEVGLRIGF